MKNILDGLRVAEISTYIAAPLCGMTLGQMGADIVQINPITGRMDENRLPHTKDGNSLYYPALNKAKRSIRIDLKRPEGRELAAQLMAGNPGDGGGIVLSNLPLREEMAPESLKKLRPDLISLQVFGNPDGSTALDFTVNCASGFPHITGNDSGPTNHVAPVWDISTALYLATGLLAAERHRRLSGEGQTITLTLADVMLATVGNLSYLNEAQINEEPRPILGNQVYGAFGKDFATADGRRVMVTGISNKQWQALCDATETNEQMQALQDNTGVDLETEYGRYAAADEISTVFDPWFAARTLDEIRKTFTGTRVLWGPFQTFKQLVNEDPRCSLDNPLFRKLDQPGLGPHLAPHVPLDFSGFPRGDVAAAPQHGEHSEAVLSDVLGLSSQNIGKLFDTGIVAGLAAD